MTGTNLMSSAPTVVISLQRAGWFSILRSHLLKSQEDNPFEEYNIVVTHAPTGF